MINSDVLAYLIRLEKRIEALEKLIASDVQSCGHPKSEIVSGDEGTSYCAECEREG